MRRPTCKLAARLARLTSTQAWSLVALGLVGLYLLPIWLFEFPRMLDYPSHLVMARQLLEVLRDPQAADWYVMPMPWPNVTFCLALAGLQTVLDVNLAGKLLVSLGVVAMVPSMALLLRRFGLPRWGALFVLPLLAPLLDFGVCPFLWSLPLVLVAMAAAPAVSTVWRSLAFAALAALVFFTHVTGFVILGPAALVAALAGAPRHRLRTVFLVGLGYAIPTVLLFVVWAASLPPAAFSGPHSGEGFSWPMFPLSRLYSLVLHHRWTVDLWEYRLLALVLLALPLGWLVRHGRGQHTARFWPAAAVALLGVALPTSSGVGFLLGERVLLVAAMLALLWIPLQPTSRGARLHLALVLALAATHALVRLPGAARFNAHVEQARLMARSLPLGSNMLMHRRPSPWPDELATWPYHHVHAYFFLWRRVYSNMLPSSVRTTVVQGKHGRLHPLMRRTIFAGADLNSPLAADVPFALCWAPEKHMPPKGLFQPVYAAGLATLHRNPACEGARLRLPSVEQACTVRPGTAGTETACCPHRLSWIDAYDSCRQWGGQLAWRIPADPTPRWVPLSSRGDPGRPARRVGRGQPAPGPRLRYRRCAMADGRVGGILATACAEVARPLCQPRSPGAAAQLSCSGARRLEVAGQPHVLLDHAVVFDEARHRCAACGGRLALLPGPAKAEEVLGLAVTPVWVDLLQRQPDGPWSTTDERRMDWAAPLMDPQRTPALCGVARPRLGLLPCKALFPFCCQRVKR